jgi:hypothetical protein
MPDSIQIPPNGSSKIVQLYIDGKPVLRAGDGFHRCIFGAALDEFGIAYGKIALNKDSSGSDPIMGPARDDGEGGRYKLVGAGSCLRVGKELIFHSKSRDYMVGVDREHLEKRCGPEFEKEGLVWELSDLSSF